jgi:hypothetical protein
MPIITPEEKAKTAFGLWLTMMIFGILWAIAGLLALLWSILCFGKSGSTGQKVAGILLAIFFGPFYFIYYWTVQNYCR